ncbi:MAG: helix-turn-helix transcriptional regulator [Akkermansia sp.]|nr:helix-turn-helix transcriptional regulator [Akkermansia sp.]
MKFDAKTAVENIARYIQKSGLDKKDVAERAHIAAATLSNWLAGRSKPSLGGLYAVAQGLGCTVEELMVPQGEHTIEKIDGLSIEQWRARALVADQKAEELTWELRELRKKINEL